MPNGFDSYLGKVNDKILLPSSTSDQMLEAYGLDDRGHYIAGGKIIVEKGFSEAQHDWRMLMWKPGMFVLHALLMLLGKTSPTAFFMILISSSLWAKIFHKTATIITKFFRINQATAFALPLLLLLTLPQFRFVVLQHQLFASETYAFATFFLGLLYSVNFLLTNKKTDLSKAGIFFALASYIRQSSDFIMIFFGIILVAMYLLSYLAKRSNINLLSEEFVTTIKKSSLIFLVCFSLMLIGKIHDKRLISNGADFLYMQSWLTDEQLGGSDNFVVVGGGNSAACKIAPDICEDFQKRDIANKGLDQQFLDEIITKTKKTILLHPFSWLYYKMPFALQYWFNDSHVSSGATVNTINSILLILVTGIMVLPFFATSRVNIFSSLIMCTLIIGSLIPILIFHIEPRYLFQIKIAAVLLSIIIASDFINRRRINQNAR